MPYEPNTGNYIPPGGWSPGARWAQQQMLGQYGVEGVSNMRSRSPGDYQRYMGEFMNAYQPPDPQRQGYGMQTGAQGYQGGPQGKQPYWWLQGYKPQQGAMPQGPQFSPYSGGQQFQQWQGGQQQQFTPWQGGSIQAPGAWQAPDTGIPEAGVDTRAVVEANRHYLDETMGGQMADAARQMAAAGVGLEGSEYVGKLGEAQRARDRDLAGMYYQYDMQAAEADANRRAAARENMLNRDLNAWQTQGGWDMQGQMADQANQYGAWQMQNQWNQGQNAQDFAAWQAQNAWNQQQNAQGYDAWNAQNQWAQQQYQNQMNAWNQQNANQQNWFNTVAGMVGPGQQLTWNPQSIL